MRKDQERPVDVRVLERGTDAVVVEENAGAGYEMEKADITSRGRDQRRQNVAAPQDREAHQIAVAEQTGEHHGGDAEVNRRAGILNGFGLIADLDQRHKSADQPQHDQKQQRDELAVEADAGANASDEKHHHQAVMGRRLDEGDRAGQDGDEQDEVEKPLRQRGIRAGIVHSGKRQRRIAGVHQ